MPFKNLNWFSGIFLIVISFNFYFSLPHYKESVFNDIRTRVVGSRLASEHKNAYFHKFDPQQDAIYLLDPFEKTAQLVNGNTVTPTVLMVFHLLHKQPQNLINLFWTIFCYAAFFCIIFLFYIQFQKKCTSHQQWFLLWSILMLGVVGWRMHLLSGQIYIIYTLLAIVSLHLYECNKIIAAAVLAGLVTAMRLPYGLLFLPFLLSNQKMLFYFCVFVGLSLVATILFYDTTIWFNYFESMKIHGLENAHAIPEINDPKQLNIPAFIENTPTIASSKLQEYIRFLDADIFSVQKLLIQLELKSNTLVLGFLLLVCAALLFIILGKKHLFHKKENLLLYCSMLLLMSDYFLPTLRFNYNFVQFLIPLFILHIYDFKVSTAVKFLFTVGIFLNIVKLNWIPECYSVGELLCLIALGICLKKNK